MALFQQGMFQINPRDTPETIARKRALANQIMNGPAVAPRSTADGIGNAFASIMGGIAARNMNSKADAAERAGQESAASAFNPLLDAFRSRVGLDAGGFPAAPNPGNSTSMATMPAPDTASARVAQAHGGGVAVPQGERAGYIRNGLIQRGLPDHVADAFLMNFQDESGLDPGINERAPLVPGSRGGYGLYQLTGPRRRQYEAFAAQRGVDPSDIDAQLDFLMQEGSGSERAAFDRILAAPDTGSAAVEIVNRFLRPAQSHRESRAARYSRAPNTAVAANEAMAAGELSNGLTPDALQQWAFANYAPQPANGAVDAVNALGEAQPVGIAESEADILAQEQAMMAQDQQAFQQPGTQPRLQAPAAPQSAPPLPPAQFVQDRPIQGIQTAQAGGFPEMAGNNPQALPAPGIDMQMIANVLTNPFSNPEQRAFAQMLLEQQLQAQDPYRQAQIAQLQAQTERLQRQAQGGDTRFGLNPIYGQDAEGNTVLGVLGDDGSFKPVDTGGVNISTGVDRVDLGTHYGLLDKRSGQMVGTLPKENYQEAFDTARGGAEGKAQGEAAVNLPTDLATSEQALSELDALIAHPGLSAIAGPFDQYRPSWMMGAEGRDALARFNQAKGRAFLQAFGMLKGGGQITEIEGLKAEQAMARMDRAQGEEEFKQALQDFRDAVATGMDKMRQRAGQQPASGSDWQDVGGVRIRRKQ